MIKQTINVMQETLMGKIIYSQMVAGIIVIPMFILLAISFREVRQMLIDQWNSYETDPIGWVISWIIAIIWIVVIVRTIRSAYRRAKNELSIGE
jgi:uncharacterized membrane protein